MRVLLFGAALVVIACGGPGQSAQCKKYLTCVKAVSGPSPEPAGYEAYQENGSCWSNATTAQQCTESCSAATENLRQAHPDAGC